MKGKRDFFGGILFTVIGVLYFILGTGISVPDNLSEPGGRLFPFIAGAGMAVCGMGMALTALKNREEEKPFMDRAGWFRFLRAAIVVLLYYFGLNYLGFLISTPIFVVVIIYTLSAGKTVNPLMVLLVAILTTGILYFVFQKIFVMFLPTGIVFG